MNGELSDKHNLLEDWFLIKEKKHNTSTQKHRGSWYVDFRFQNREVYAALSQAKVFSTARLYNRLGQIAEDDMEKVKSGFRKLYIDE